MVWFGFPWWVYPPPSSCLVCVIRVSRAQWSRDVWGGLTVGVVLSSPLLFSTLPLDFPVTVFGLSVDILLLGWFSSDPFGAFSVPVPFFAFRPLERRILVLHPVVYDKTFTIPDP